MQRTLASSLQIASRPHYIAASSSRIPPCSCAVPRRYITTTQPLIPEQHSTPLPASTPAPSTSTPSTSPSSSSSSPYFIRRTEETLSLPVYSSIQNGGSKREIVVRHVSGDLQTLQNELVNAFDTKVHTKDKIGSVIISNTSGRLSVHDVKLFLQEKGF